MTKFWITPKHDGNGWIYHKDMTEFRDKILSIHFWLREVVPPEDYLFSYDSGLSATIEFVDSGHADNVTAFKLRFDL